MKGLERAFESQDQSTELCVNQNKCLMGWIYWLCRTVEELESRICLSEWEFNEAN